MTDTVHGPSEVGTTRLLDQHQCWELLRSVSIGRLAVSTEDRPDIFPVNYVVDHATIIFRTAAGTKVAALIANDAVAFEADGVDLSAGSAWSVVVKGRATPITQAHELLDTFDMALNPYEPQAKQQFIRIVPVGVTGRGFAVVNPARWLNPLSDRPRAAVE